MSRENEKQKSGNAFINALKKSNMTAMAAILVVMIIIASIVSPYFLNRHDWYCSIIAFASWRTRFISR